MEKKVIKLVKDTIDNNDIDELIEWLKTYPRLTKGSETEQFEKEWSKWMGVKYSVFVNSGSSANLMMLYALIASKRIRNKKVIVPALSWATDLAPVIQLGLEPILVDISKETLAVSIESLEEVFKKENPGALLLVSVLGIPPNMNEITTLCKKYGVTLLEDACESLGSCYDGKKLGTFGYMSSFSLYFGHHISTIEGGMICTDDYEMYNVLKMIRSHGWDRDLDTPIRDVLREKWDVSEFDGLYTFYIPGFNLRSTDLQAKIGRRQLLKLDKIGKDRNKNFIKYDELLNESFWRPSPPQNSFVSNFAYPMIHKMRDKIVKELQENSIEVRPLISGSMGTQPFYIDRYGRKEFHNASLIDKYGFYLPNHPELEETDIQKICDIINKYA